MTKDEFPFFWIDKPSMASLQTLANHLKDKSWSLRQALGFTGEATPMEKQLIERLILVQQELLTLTDVVYGSLLILDENRPSQRAKRAVNWVRETIRKAWRTIEENTIYKILSIVGALAILRVIFTFISRWIRTLLR